MARSFLAKIRRYVGQFVRHFPGGGTRCDELEPSLLRGIVGEYLIFYTFDATQIKIWRVLNGRRQITTRQFRR